MTASKLTEGSSAVESLDTLYPGRWALLLTPLCGPGPHQHGGKDCDAAGKRPLGRGWNAEAIARMKAGSGREQYIADLAEHLAQGGNVGLVLPDEVVAIDADTPEAVVWCDTAMPDAPMQDTAKGGHFLVRVPPNTDIRATVAVEIVDGVRVDVRAPGRSHVVVEPSIHSTGAEYSWKRSLPATRSELPECPWPILEGITSPTSGARANGTRNGAKRVEKGGRNDYLYRIGCGMRGRGLSSGEIAAELSRENAQRCNPPLDEGEVAGIAESVLKHAAGGEDTGDTSPKKAEVTRLAQLENGDYEAERKPAAKALGYRVTALDEMVSARRKEAAKPPAKDDPKESEKIREQVPALALEKNILARLEDVLRAMGVVGERIVAVLVFLMATARILDVKCPGGAVVKGQSSCGKSYVTSAILSLFPPEVMLTLTAMSQRALVYLPPDSLRHKVLNIAEATVLAEKKGEDNLAALFVRSLLSEGRIDYAVPIKEDGAITSVMIEQQGPASLVVTTTKASLDPELETRLLSVLSDDTSKHTADINLATGKRFAGAVSKLDPKPWHDLQRWLQAHTPLNVVVPYAKELAGLLPTSEIRSRRDTERLLILICAHAAMHLHHRERDEAGRVVATLEDYEAVRRHLGSLFAQAAGQAVHKSIRDTVEAVRDLRAKGDMAVTSAKVAASLDIAASTAWSRVTKALLAGYLVNEEERSRQPAKLALGETVLPKASESAALPTRGALEAALGRDDVTNLEAQRDDGGFVTPTIRNGNGKRPSDDVTTQSRGVGQEEEDEPETQDSLPSETPPEIHRHVVTQAVSLGISEGSGDDGRFVTPPPPIVTSSRSGAGQSWTTASGDQLLAEMRRLKLFPRRDGESLSIEDSKGDIRVSRLPVELLDAITANRDDILAALDAELNPPTPEQVKVFN